MKLKNLAIVAAFVVLLAALMGSGLVLQGEAAAVAKEDYTTK